MSLINRLKKLTLQESDENNKSMEKTIDIYDIVRVLDNLKNNSSFRKVYKTRFSYEWRKNSVSLKFQIDGFRSTKDFTAIIESEFFRDMIQDLQNNGVSSYFISRVSKIRSYNIDMLGNTVLFHTDFIKVLD